MSNKKFIITYSNLKTGERKIINVYKKEGWMLRKMKSIIDKNPDKWELEYDFFKGKGMFKPKDKNEVYSVIVIPLDK